MSPIDRLPPLTALRAFEAVSRKLSFARAAEELHVTKAAVAQQVRALEQEIGAPLVERSGRGLALTEAGAAGALGLAEGFAILARAARAMREAKGRRFLVINSSPSFAATWLVGRIGRFKTRHPEIDVLLDANPTEDTLDFEHDRRADPLGSGRFPGARDDAPVQGGRFSGLLAGPRRRRPSAALAGRSRPPYPAASRMEPGLSVLAGLVGLAQGRRRKGRRGAARRLVQQHGDGDSGRRARAGGGAELLRHRRRRTCRRPPRRALLDQRPNAFRLLFPLPAGGGADAEDQGLARVPGRGGGAVGGGAGMKRGRRRKRGRANFCARPISRLGAKTCNFVPPAAWRGCRGCSTSLWRRGWLLWRTALPQPAGAPPQSPELRFQSVAAPF